MPECQQEEELLSSHSLTDASINISAKGALESSHSYEDSYVGVLLKGALENVSFVLLFWYPCIGIMVRLKACSHCKLV